MMTTNNMPKNVTPEQVLEMGATELDASELQSMMHNTEEDLQKSAVESINDMVKGFEDMVENLISESKNVISTFDKNGTDNLSPLELVKLNEALLIDANMREFKDHVNLLMYVANNKVEGSVSTSINLIMAQFDKYKHYCRSKKIGYVSIDSVLNRFSNLSADAKEAIKEELTAFYYTLKYFNENKKMLGNRSLYIRLTLNMLLMSILSSKRVALSSNIYNASK